RLFFERGARVALLARTSQDLLAVAHSLEQGHSGDRVMVCPADVSDADQVKKVFHRIRGAWGPVGILVNNAGTLVNRSVLGTSESDWQRVLGVNLSGSFYCSKEAFAHMGELGGGNIIN